MSIVDTHPEIAAQWSPNNTLDINKITYGSNKKASWICPIGHEYLSSVSKRTNGRGCPYCVGKKVLVGFNDLQTQYPKISERWSGKNKFGPDQITSGSGEKVWWVCIKGHEYEMLVSSMVKGYGCPVCANKKILKGFNDLKTTHPDITKEWSGKNDFCPDEIIAGSHKKAWWVCPKGHEYYMKILARANLGRNCHYCSNDKVLQGFNDLATTHPDIAKQWSNKNILKPTEVTFGSDKKAWWVCSKGHESFVTIKTKINCEIICGYCSNYKVLKGFNDLFTTHKELTKQWSEKNDISFYDVTYGSKQKVWWKCHLGHEWEATVNSRTGGRDCPKCSLGKRVSKPEQAVADFVKSLDFDIEQSNRTRLGGLELDIYIPSIDTGIEFNGTYWHSTPEAKARDAKKKKLCDELGIRLIVIKEEDWYNDEHGEKVGLFKILNGL